MKTLWLIPVMVSLCLPPAASMAGSSFNRCKKFSSYPAIEQFHEAPKHPLLTPALPSQLRDKLTYIVDPKADYAGYLHVIELPLDDEGYRYWFWDLRSGRLISGPNAHKPALWREDSRLFITPTLESRASEYNQQGYLGGLSPDTARYYVWDEDQHDPDQSLILELNCGD